MKTFFTSRNFLYLVLLLLGLPILMQTMNYPWDKEAYEQLMHMSGELSVRLLIFTLLITPVRLMFPNSVFWKWALKQRRPLGVAVFVFAMLHMLIYVLQQANITTMLNDLGQINYVFAWGSILILIPLAVTSTNVAIRKMGAAKWKRLHRLVYVAAVFAMLHWLLKQDGNTLGPVMVHFVPLAVFQLYRIFRYYRKSHWLETTEALTNNKT